MVSTYFRDLKFSFHRGLKILKRYIFWYSYEVEFSKPKNMKPIPEGTVKVYFSIIEAEGGENEIEFNFENESLKHRVGNTMRNNMYEVSVHIKILTVI